MYTVKDHRLVLNDTPVEFFPSPNTSGDIRPKFLVIHFTAGATGARETAQYFQKPSAKTSAHLSMDYDGSVVQSVAFNTKAWHAGRSNWAGYKGLNSHSIGIEVCNPGPLTRTASGTYTTWWGKEIDPSTTLVIDAPHPNNPNGQIYGWIPFTPEQMESLIEIGSLLMEEYDLQECVGHDMISPGRKTDPGPCMDGRVYDRINSLAQSSNELVWRVSNVSTFLNGRSGPSTNNSVVQQLPKGTALEVIQRAGVWWKVETQEGQELWVHSKFLSAHR